MDSTDSHVENRTMVSSLSLLMIRLFSLVAAARLSLSQTDVQITFFLMNLTSTLNSAGDALVEFLNRWSYNLLIIGGKSKIQGLGAAVFLSVLQRIWGGLSMILSLLFLPLYLAKASNNVKYVNPMIGTDNIHSGNGNYGGMIPTVGSPFAFTRWSPMTYENTVGTCPYVYQDELFRGFIGTHQPAQWMGESGEVVVSAGTGTIKTLFDDRGLKYSHDDEISSPQYYKSILSTETGRIIAEATAVSRSSLLRFTFDDNSTPYVAIQATRDSINGEINIDPQNREIYGWNPERQDDVLGPSPATNFKGYFVAQFDSDFTSWGISHGSLFDESSTHGTGATLSAYVTFLPNSKPVNIRVGVSYISYELARESLMRETPVDQSLEDIVATVEAQWTEKLDLVEIDNASNDERAIFYTAMYHALQYPSEMMEYNSTGVYYYSGYDDTVHAGIAYTGYSIWDTFRSEWAFLNLFAPERIDDMIQSMLQSYQQGGRLPIWQNIVETNIMIGTHSSSLIAESLAKGFNGFDLDLAWEAIYKDAMVPPEDDLTTYYGDRQEGVGYEARAGLTRELELGYVAAMLTSEAGSRTLEYAYDDYTVGVAAQFTGHQDQAEYFFERSKNYRNIWNKDTLFMEAKYENGTWCSNPTTWTEATNWVYTFNVQHDFAGLRDLFLGAENFEKKLDEYFENGHNDHTNEPSHATAFAYFYANQPSKAQSTIRSLLQNNYWNTPIGLSGNDDCGQMSSWYIFNSLGFYPVNPASGEYIIGSPLFDKVSISLPQTGNTLSILAKGAGKMPYVKSLTVDGHEVASPILRHTDLLKTKEISFEMSRTPQPWGKDTL